MSLLRGAQLAAYLIGAPGGAGTAAHLLSQKYLSLMNFEGNFFLVKAVTELYDDGIPKIPESIKNAVEKIVQQLQQQQQQQQQAAEQKQEVFTNKGYWCRYFDYSRGAAHVIMEYDKNCQLYNIFEVKGTASASEPKKVSAENSTDSASNSTGKVYDISKINEKEKTIDNLKLSKNQDFQKGAFYLLQLDKSKFSRLNTLSHIELTEVGTERLAEQTYQTKIATLKIKAPLKGDIKDLSLNFADSKLPSSILLLKKVKKEQQAAQQASSSGGDTGGDSSGKSKTHFLKQASSSGAGTSSNDKLQVLGMWEFPPQARDKADPSRLDPRYLDKVQWDDLKNGEKKPGTGILGFLLGLLPKEYDNYFVAKTLSDFWKYKVGDKLKLVESQEGGSAGEQVAVQVSDNGASSSSTTETELAEFEVVSGLLLHLSSPIQCIPHSTSWLGELMNWQFKKNFSLTGNKSVYSERKNPTYCKPQEGIPPYIMIFLGKNISDMKVSAVSKR